MARRATLLRPLRKLQAIIRDDVSSAYGRRAELGDVLEGAGARGLNESLAGQSMSSVLPRGLRGAVTSTGGMGAIGMAGGLNPATLASALAYGLSSSPRVVGEAAHAAGRAGGAVSTAATHVPPGISPMAFQLGRGQAIGDPRRPAPLGARQRDGPAMNMAAKALLLALGAASLASNAGAAGLWCGDRAGIVKSLASKYGEAPVSMGVAANGSLLQVLASPDGETWTVLLIRPSGIACIMATGENWGAADPSPPGNKI